MKKLVTLVLVCGVLSSLFGCDGNQVGDTPAPTPKATGAATPPAKGANPAEMQNDTPKGKSKNPTGEAPE